MSRAKGNEAGGKNLPARRPLGGGTCHAIRGIQQPEAKSGAEVGVGGPSGHGGVFLEQRKKRFHRYVILETEGYLC